MLNNRQPLMASRRSPLVKDDWVNAPVDDMQELNADSIASSAIAEMFRGFSSSSSTTLKPNCLFRATSLIFRSLSSVTATAITFEPSKFAFLLASLLTKTLAYGCRNSTGA
jgi:hypothetical protein